MIKVDKNHVSINCDEFEQMAAEAAMAVNSAINECTNDGEVRAVIACLFKVMNDNEAVHRVMDLEYFPGNDDTNPDPEGMA